MGRGKEKDKKVEGMKGERVGGKGGGGGGEGRGGGGM